MSLTKEEHEEIKRNASALMQSFKKVMRRLKGYAECETPEDRDTWIHVVASHDNLVHWVGGNKTPNPYG